MGVGEVVVVEVTQALPSQYWPDEQEVEEGLITQAVPLQYWPDGQVVVVVEFTHAFPSQYCPEEQVVEVVVVPPPQSLGHEPELSPDSHVPLLLQAVVVVVVEVTQALPSQYCPDEHDEDVVLITHAVPLQYCPLGQSVVDVALQ